MEARLGRLEKAMEIAVLVSAGILLAVLGGLLGVGRGVTSGQRFATVTRRLCWRRRCRLRSLRKNAVRSVSRRSNSRRSGLRGLRSCVRRGKRRPG
jgi:hypothetical protein